MGRWVPALHTPSHSPIHRTRYYRPPSPIPRSTYELSTPVKDPPLNVASVLSHFLILGIRIVLGGLQKGFVLGECGG